MPGVIAALTGSAWSYGGSILSFLFPMILFLVVATSLYVVYTKPSVVPGHREQTIARPIGWTPVARMPSPGQQASGQTPAGPHYAFPSQAGQAGAGGRAAAPENPAARPGNPGGTGVTSAATALPVPSSQGPGGPAAPRRKPGAIARSLFQLTKPRIIELLLVTTIPTMLLAQRGLPSLRVFAVTLIGGTLAAASANTLNCYLDRDIDAVMRRTAHRPLVAKAGRGSIKPGEALASGIVLGAAATLLLGLVVNWLAAFLAAGAILFYVFVYTLALKRRTASNIVIGGAARCFPVLVGWAAVTGTIDWPAAALFAVIFLWTPPHFWALAMRFRDDYAAAGVPMLPVVATPQAVARKIPSTPTRWWRPRSPSLPTRGGSTRSARPGSAAGSWPRRTGCTHRPARCPPRPRAGRQVRAPRCGCSTCRSPT